MAVYIRGHLKYKYSYINQPGSLPDHITVVNKKYPISAGIKNMVLLSSYMCPKAIVGVHNNRTEESVLFN